MKLSHAFTFILEEVLRTIGNMGGIPNSVLRRAVLLQRTSNLLNIL